MKPYPIILSCLLITLYVYASTDDELELEPNESEVKPNYDYGDTSPFDIEYEQYQQNLNDQQQSARMIDIGELGTSNENATHDYPPPYMISRANFMDTCHRESDYYYNKYCTNCDKCCARKYYTICVNGFKRNDKSPYADNTLLKMSPSCDAKCEPYYSYVIASIKCRRKIITSCAYVFKLSPPSRPGPDIRLCCHLQYYRQFCMPAWNDKNLYTLPTYYQEINSPICRLLNVPAFINCNYWMNETKKLVPYFKKDDNCTIISQSNAEANHL